MPKCRRCTSSSSAAPDMIFVDLVLPDIEGHELTSGRADVVVCDGLLGNIVLKLLESVANMAVDLSSAANRNSATGRQPDCP